MNRRGALPRWCALALAVACTGAWAQAAAPAAPAATVTLSELYRQARPIEARLKVAESTFRSNAEQLPQAQAQLRPQVQLSAGRFKNSLDSTVPGLLGPVDTRDNYISRSDTLQLRQPLYRPQQWAAVKSAEHIVGAAQAQRDQEYGNFATRVATAYFDAVLSTGQVQYTRELVEQLRLQLTAAQRLFAAGQGIRTDVDEVQAQLDSALADQIEAGQYQAFSAQQLAVLLGGRPAGVPALKLETLDSLLAGADLDVGAWQERARARSSELRQLREQLAASREDLRRAESGHKPTLDLIAQRSRTQNDNVTRLRSAFDNTSLGVQLNFPIYSGGLVNSQVRQALSDVEKNEFALDAGLVDLDSRVRKEHRSVVEGIARLRALQQAVASARTAQLSAERSFQAGVRTRVDIARAIQRVAQQQRDALQSACSTLLARLRLELLTSGSEDDAAAAVDWIDRALR